MIHTTALLARRPSLRRSCFESTRSNNCSLSSTRSPTSGRAYLSQKWTDEHVRQGASRRSTAWHGTTWHRRASHGVALNRMARQRAWMN
eukprot:13174822-Heterocapsa_arctica.AAC.1